MKIVKQREQIVYEVFSTTRRGLRIVFSCIDSWQAGAASLGLNVCRTNKKGPLKVTRWNVGGMEVTISLWSNTKENFLFVFARFSLRHQTYSFPLIYFMLLNPFRSGVFHFYFYFSSPQPTYFFLLDDVLRAPSRLIQYEKRYLISFENDFQLKLSMSNGFFPLQASATFSRVDIVMDISRLCVHLTCGKSRSPVRCL